MSWENRTNKGPIVRYVISYKGGSGILEVEENVVKSVEDETLGVFQYKNWDHVKDRMHKYGWQIDEVPEIVVEDVVSAWPFIDLSADGNA